MSVRFSGFPDTATAVYCFTFTNLQNSKCMLSKKAAIRVLWFARQMDQMDFKTSIKLYKIPDILHPPDSRVIEICHFGTVQAILKAVYIPNPPPGEGTRRLGRGLTSLPSSIEADGLDSNKWKYNWCTEVHESTNKIFEKKSVGAGAILFHILLVFDGL